jgi:hypothetical protein
MAEDKQQEQVSPHEETTWTGTIHLTKQGGGNPIPQPEEENSSTNTQIATAYERQSIKFTRIIAWATAIYVVVSTFQWCALRESNRISREALTSVQRAFVFATGITLYAPVGAKSAMAIAQIENAGATAATNLVIVANRQILQSPQNLGEHFDYPDAVPGAPSPRTLGPKETTISSITPIDPTCLDLLARGEVRLFEWGRITYTDVFHVPHETDFCFFTVGGVVDYPQGSNKSLVFFPCTEHNCVDDACPKPEQRTKRVEWQDGDSICREVARAETTKR